MITFLQMCPPNSLRKPRMLLRGTGARAGLDSAWEQEKLEVTRKRNACKSRTRETQSPAACPELVEGSSAYHPGARAGRGVG